MCLQIWLSVFPRGRREVSLQELRFNECSEFASSGMTLLKHGLIHKKLIKVHIIGSGGSRPCAKGGGLDLLALLAFFPSVISSFFSK